MSQPKSLQRGKKFELLVKSDFGGQNRSKDVHFEATIPFDYKKDFKRKSGRADILITGTEDFVTVLEIKVTDWDKIKPKNVKKNLWRHQRQLFSYIDKFLDFDKMDVCPGIIYPEPPRDVRLRNLVESYLENYGVPAYWFSEIRCDQ